MENSSGYYDTIIICTCGEKLNLTGELRHNDDEHRVIQHFVKCSANCGRCGFITENQLFYNWV